jgi:hydrogenase-4 component B
VSGDVLRFVNAGIPLAVAIRLATIAAALLSGRPAAAGRALAVAVTGSIVASLLTVSVAVHVLAGGPVIGGVLLHHAASGLALSYAVAPLSAWFLMVFGVITIPVTVYSAGYLPHAIPPSRIAIAGAAFNVMLGAVELVFVAADAVTFLLVWELMTLATATLVAIDHDDRRNRRAGYLYLAMSHVGTGCLLAGFLTLAAAAGSLSLSSMLAGNLVTGLQRPLVFALFLVGFGVKAGIIPFHVWLPEAHPAAPSSVSALMSAVLITAGIYGLFRVCAFGLGTPTASWGLICMGLGAISAILGVLYALTQVDLKRLLAYSTIENSGIIVLALGAAMLARAYGRSELATVAVAASLAHVLNHAAFKALLFLGAGSVVMRTGTRHLEQFGGLLRRMPWTGLCFMVGAIAIAGLPPLNGFVSEWLTFQALLLGFGATPGFTRLVHPLGAALLALTTALAAACFVRVAGITFLALPRSAEAAAAREAPPAMLLPQAGLALLCLALGVLPGTVLRALGSVVASLPGLQPIGRIAWGGTGLASPVRSFDHLLPAMFAVALLAAVTAAALFTSRRGVALRRVPTWGCGGDLSARTQYTATAFSKPLMMIFRAVYRPTREVEALADVSPYYPHEVRYRSAIEPVFERYVYGPLLRGVLRVANGMKALQAGSLHAYLAYVLALGVLLLLWLGGTK